MADIELVIKIPEEKYNYAKNQVAEGIDNPWKVCIATGTPLPKGHGRLIDADAIPGDSSWDFADRLDGTPTIVEADKEESRE